MSVGDFSEDSEIKSRADILSSKLDEDDRAALVAEARRLGANRPGQFLQDQIQALAATMDDGEAREYKLGELLVRLTANIHTELTRKKEVTAGINQ